jgi:hypothetical protein
VVRIAIGAEAFEAIAQTLPLGSVSYENASTIPRKESNREIIPKALLVDS